MNSIDNQLKHDQDIQEDFSLILPQEINDPIKFFHNMIRCKYYKRIKNDFLCKNPKKKHFEGFQLVDSTFDHYEYYQQNFSKLKQFNEAIEHKYLLKLIEKIRQFKHNKVEQQFKNKVSKSQQFKHNISDMIEEFKLQIDLLIDCFDKADIYNLLEEQNFKKINKFSINCNRLQDIMVPFFLSKFFGQLNEISSQIFVKVFMGLVSKTINVNISTWSSFFPDICLFKEDSWLSDKLEEVVFSKFFDVQKKQLLFLFGNLNTLLHDLIFMIQKHIDSLYYLDRPLDFDQYLDVQENINIKFKEIKEFKLPSQKNQILNVNQIRKIVDIDLKEEIRQSIIDQKQELDREEDKDQTEKEDYAIQEFDLKEIQTKIKKQKQLLMDFEKVEEESFFLEGNKEFSKNDFSIENFQIEQFIQQMNYNIELYSLLISEKYQILKKNFDQIYSPYDIYPKIFKSVIRKFVFDLKYHDLIQYSFSNLLNTILIVLAVSNVFLISFNFFAMTVFFVLLISCFYLHLKQKNLLKQEIMDYLIKTQIHYSKVLGSCIKFSVSIQQTQKLFFFTKYDILIDIYLLKEFIKTLQEKQNQSELCWQSFQQNNQQKKRLQNIYRIPYQYIKNYQEGILPVQDQPPNQSKVKRVSRKRQTKFKQSWQQKVKKSIKNTSTLIIQQLIYFQLQWTTRGTIYQKQKPMLTKQQMMLILENRNI